jgi:formyltetrahydrofolate deformylase
VTTTTTATLRVIVSCPDGPGIVAAVSRFLFEVGANIVRSDQYSTGPADGAFFLRMEFTIPEESQTGVAERFGSEVADEFGMTWRFSNAATRKRLAILVSRQDHCLLDLLWRWRRGALDAEIVLVASNHLDLREAVESFDVPLHHTPIDPSEKAKAEAALLGLLAESCDVIVLARYMQILSGDFLTRVEVPLINIHHSFLPAFAGGRPYEQAWKRGVKLVGATAHYVTEQLDAGPIIEQDVIRVTHRDDVRSLTRLGADIERDVLARAVEWHCQDRVLLHGNTTIVF